MGQPDRPSPSSPTRTGLALAAVTVLVIVLTDPPSSLVWVLTPPLAFLVGTFVADRRLDLGPPPNLPVPVLDRMWSADVEGVVVRRPTRSDARGVAATVDAEVIRASGLPADFAKQIKALFYDPALALRLGTFVIGSSDGDESTIHGVVQFHRYDPDANRSDLGLWLGPLSRGRGIAPRAIHAAAQLAGRAGVTELRLGTSVENGPMLSAFRRSGAQPVEEGPHVLPDGTVVTSSWWMLTCPTATDGR